MNLRERSLSKRILAATDRIYGAALERSRWTEALDAVKDLVGGTAVSLRAESFDTGAIQQTWLGFDPAFQKAYFEHYWREDVCSSAWPVGHTKTADALVPIAVRRRTAFFNDLCVPFQLDDLVGGLVESSKSGTIALAIMRPRGRKAFDESDAEVLDVLLPHLRRAVQINGALETAASEKALAWSVFDRLPVGVFALDGNQRVRFVNRAGEKMIGNGIRIDTDGIAAELPNATRDLRRGLGAARSSANYPVASPIAIALPRRNATALSAIAMPIDSRTRLELGRTEIEVLLVVTDPSAQVEPPASLLVRLYGLTAAEARVAVLVGRGLAPKEVANELGTAWNTVRCQLRQVYAKTQTTGQSALVRRLTMLGVVSEHDLAG